MVRLKTPLQDADIRSLKLGCIVYVNGIIYTGTDKIHRYISTNDIDVQQIPFDLKGGIIYHCSPILKNTEEGYSVVSAGPITSDCCELYQGDVIKKLSLKAVIGKGGMGESTIKAMKENGCVYMSAIGGTAVYLANRVKNVIGKWTVKGFSEVESMWALQVEDFPTIVTIDAHANSLHHKIKDISSSNIKALFS